jgi:hypothetical protein
LRRRRPTPGASAPLKADFNRRESLRPTVGLRRPERPSSRRRRPTPGAQRLGRPISIGTKAFGQRSTCADRKSTLRVGEGRCPARKRLEGPISIGTKAFGRRSACTPNEFGLQGPPADGRPAPTRKTLLASAKADFNRHRAFGRRPARRMNSASRGLRPTVGLRRPERPSSRRRRPTPGASAPSKADFNRHRASGRRSAYTPNEFGLQGPPANGRPAPTRKTLLASAKADARRVSAFEGRFQSAQSLRPTVGLHAE